MQLRPLYAFCREVDDVVDECTDASVARTKLAWWRQEVAAIFNAGNGNEPSHPVAKALVNVSKTFNLTAERLNANHRRHGNGPEPIIGMPISIPCGRTATMWRAWWDYVPQIYLAIVIRETLKYAENLGLAFQLTNIIRDVGEDARRDRIYLPQDELVRFGVYRAGYPQFA